MSKAPGVYLDHNATSPLRDEALQAMLPWLSVPANPASVHSFGRAAAAVLDAAREEIAGLFGARPDDVVFTSGATEANHQAVRGLLGRRPGAHVVSDLEHPCVLAASELAGAPNHRLAARADGRVDLENVPGSASLVSLLMVQHETGVIQPVQAAAEVARRLGAALHVDATAAVGKVVIPHDLADALVLSSHKLGGPPGVGALVLRDGRSFPPLFPGAQERGRRGGTVPTALVAGFAAAVRAAARLDAVPRWTDLQARLEDGLVALGGRVVGSAPRVTTTTLAVFPGVRGDALVAALDLAGIAVSAGAACASGAVQASRALLAMGDPEPHGALRVSFGSSTTQADIATLLAALPSVLAGLRGEGDWLAWLDGESGGFPPK